MFCSAGEETGFLQSERPDSWGYPPRCLGVVQGLPQVGIEEGTSRDRTQETRLRLVLPSVRPTPAVGPSGAEEAVAATVLMSPECQVLDHRPLWTPLLGAVGLCFHLLLWFPVSGEQKAFPMWISQTVKEPSKGTVVLEHLSAFLCSPPNAQL